MVENFGEITKTTETFLIHVISPSFRRLYRVTLHVGQTVFSGTSHRAGWQCDDSDVICRFAGAVNERITHAASTHSLEITNSFR